MNDDIVVCEGKWTCPKCKNIIPNNTVSERKKNLVYNSAGDDCCCKCAEKSNFSDLQKLIKVEKLW